MLGRIGKKIELIRVREQCVHACTHQHTDLDKRVRLSICIFGEDITRLNNRDCQGVDPWCGLNSHVSVELGK